MTGTRLATELAERLNEVLPRGFTASAAGNEVRIQAPDGLGGNGWAGAVDQDPDDVQLLHGAVWTVLSSAQDVVAETAGTPWPQVAGPGLDLALPGSRIHDQFLYVWFGEERAPALTLRPIGLAPG